MTYEKSTGSVWFVIYLISHGSVTPDRREIPLATTLGTPVSTIFPRRPRGLLPTFREFVPESVILAQPPTPGSFHPDSFPPS